MAADTIVHRLLAQRDRRPSAPAYFVKHHGVWRPTSWRDYVVEIRTAARALMALADERRESRQAWEQVHELRASAAGGWPSPL